MNRRGFLASVAAAVLTAGIGTTALLQNDDDEAAYPHVTLDSSTLAQYPDSTGSFRTVLESDDFSDKTVLVEIGAGWCPYCARMKPEMDKALDSLAEQGADIARLTVIYQEGDHVTYSKGTFAYKQTVEQIMAGRSFPETQIWQDGKQVGFFSGAVPADEIEAILKANIKGLVPEKSSQLQVAPAHKPA